MNTKTLSTHAFSVIDQYMNFTVGTAVTGVPYFNNKTVGARAALRATIGKGSTKDIFEETDIILKRKHIEAGTLTSETLKKLFVDNNIGIDCSGFAYHVLKKTNYSFPYAGGFFRRQIAKFNPVKNINVKTFAHASNSTPIPLRNVEPGDIITMVGNGDASRNHIVIIDQIEYQNDIPSVIHYVHSMAWPSDGQYGHGFHSGKIEIINIEKPLTDQIWSEDYTKERALQTTCELRRLVVS
jgi:hypothetical protein